MHPPPFRETDTAQDWPNCCLEARCSGCEKVTVVALRMFLRDYGRVRVLDLVGRLRCRECGLRPAPVYLCASQYRARTGGGGPSPDWSLELVPPPSPTA